MTVCSTDAERVAIAKAGEAEQREPAVLVRMVMLEWLKERGHLK